MAASRCGGAAVARLDATTFFNIVAYNNDARPMSDKLVPATSAVEYQATQRIDELGTCGGTYSYGALTAAFYALADGDGGARRIRRATGSHG